MKQNMVEIITNDMEILTDDTMREIRKHGTDAFPFQCYLDRADWSHGHIREWHWHNEFEILQIKLGSIQCRIHEKRFNLHAGDGLFINAGTIHSFAAVENEQNAVCEFVNILFTPKMIAPVDMMIYEKYIQPVLYSGAECMVLKQDCSWQNQVMEWVETIEKECRLNNPMMELRIHMDICALWLEMAGHVEEYRRDNKVNKNMLNQARLQKMMQYIWQHYTEHISIPEIAGAANISHSAALRCFHAGIQMSPVEYLNYYRMNRAKEKMLHSNDTILEIALSVGFDNVPYFNRVFKRSVGITPKEFIRQETKRL